MRSPQSAAELNKVDASGIISEIEGHVPAGPLCADCTSFPSRWRDMARFCPSTQATVEFLQPACDLQRQRCRPRTLGLAIDKLISISAPLPSLTRRLRDIGEEIEARKKRAALPVYPGFPQPPVPNLEVGGTVYFVDSEPYTKIGFTSGTIEGRIAGLKGANPHPLTIYATIPGPMRLERYLHKVFEAYRYQLEWFRFDDEARTKIGEFVNIYGGSLIEKGLDAFRQEQGEPKS